MPHMCHVNISGLNGGVIAGLISSVLVVYLVVALSISVYTGIKCYNNRK